MMYLKTHTHTWFTLHAIMLSNLVYQNSKCYRSATWWWLLFCGGSPYHWTHAFTNEYLTIEFGKFYPHPCYASTGTNQYVHFLFFSIFFPLRFVLVDTDLGFFHGSLRVFVDEVCVFPRVFPRVDIKMAKTSIARKPNPRRRSSNTSVKV